MCLSVNVATTIITDSGGNTWASITVQSEGLTGSSGPVPWSELFTKGHTIVLAAPTGRQRMSVKTIKKRSTKQERKRIEAIGGRRHAGSGALSGNKSDGSTDRWRMENKFTTAESYRVSFDDLVKIRSECRGFQVPVFNIDFQDKHTGATKDSWVLLPTKEWERLVNASSNNS